VTDDLYVVTREQADPRLGRQVVHDPESRRFEFPRSADLPTRSFTHRVYGPSPTPSQRIGCCTGVDQCVKANTLGNRVKGKIFTMADAERFYGRATQLDPWPGSYPPEDTGSSGLAACKAMKEAGEIERYEWILGGVDQVLTALPKKPVGVGTWWKEGMFNTDPETDLIDFSGPYVGGHQYTLIGWDQKMQAFIGLCWWGRDFGYNGRFKIRKNDLATLLHDDGDAHVTYRAGVSA
jgi:hypothetical protein